MTTIEGGKEASLVERLEESAAAFRTYPIFTADGDPVLLTVQADELAEAAARIETLERERDEARAACRAGLATLKGVGVTAGARVLMLSRQVALDDARKALSSSQGGGNG